MIINGRNTIEVKDAIIRFKNFSGKEKKAMVNGRMSIVNEEGKRNFTLIVDPQRSTIWCNDEQVTDPNFGEELGQNRFKVTVKPGNDEGELEYRLQVHVGFDQMIPEIYLVPGPGAKPQLLTEETIGILDNATIEKADLVINNGKVYLDRNGEERVKCWCNEAYFTIRRSRFADDYTADEEV